MINPINLMKPDDIRGSDGKTFHIGQLPDYEQEDYDLSNPKDFEKFIKDVESEVRGSFEYRELVKYLREHAGMDRSGLNPNISSTDAHKVKIEIHHTPMCLGDITRVVYEKRRLNHEDLSLEMVAKEVMECHYKGIVGLFPLTSTEHELVHNGYLFIPPSNVFGRPDLFRSAYGQYIDAEDQNVLEEIDSHEKTFNPSDQNYLLSQSNVFLDPNGAYEVPKMNLLAEKMTQRIETVKNNMYALPVLGEEEANSQPVMKPAVYFVDEKGDITDEPIS